MTQKQCVRCGDLNPTESNYCSKCGSSIFEGAPPDLAARPPQGDEPIRSSAVRISTGRLIIATVLSAGLYLLYWAYLTWKQLAAETNDRHYPIWHALCLVVPVYNLFRMHQHARVIQELASRQGITSTLAPGLAVVLLLVSSALDLSSYRVTNYAALVFLSIVSTLLTTTLVVQAQEGLNRYWARVRPDGLSYARVGIGEVVIVGLGIIVWILILIPPSALE